VDCLNVQILRPPSASPEGEGILAPYHGARVARFNMGATNQNREGGERINRLRPDKKLEGNVGKEQEDEESEGDRSLMSIGVRLEPLTNRSEPKPTVAAW
jgi:hypothetical protein